MLDTVKVPKQFEPIFEKAQESVSTYFKEKKEDPTKGIIEISGQRYILVRAASMSVDFFDTIKELYKDKGEEESINVARQFLFDIAHAIGKEDAKNFHSRMQLKDPVEKFSAGPIHFSHSGWAFVDIFPESRLSSDENYCLIYDHPFSFESDAWEKSHKKSTFPVCVMNAGYFSGWCEESFGITLVASEIMCKAKWDNVCRFIMAHPSKIEGYIKAYLKKEPKLAKEITAYEIPSFFKLKQMEEVRTKAENALRESEEKYRTFFVESKDAMMTASPDEGFLSGNPAAIRMFNCRDEKDFTSRSPAELSPKNQPDGALSSDKAREMMMLALEKGANFFEWTHKRIGGTEFPATVLLSRVEKGGKVYLQSTVHDITESKKAANEALKDSQEQLFQASKMASMGQLSAGAAHEINNPLTAIVGFTQAMLKDLENQKFSSDKITHDLRIVLKNAERCKVIINNLLNFVRAKELQRQKSDINSLIDDALSFVEYKNIIQNIQVVKKYEKNLPKVNIDQDQIVQVFINVISNAQNAMPDGGKLFVSTLSENNFAVIEFKDTGIGIEKENLLRVFDPFFTTRQPGQGVGLGLSVSYSIMKGHEGSIEAKSDGKNKGASFIIKIPV